MGLRFTHLYSDDAGETHFADLELTGSAAPDSSIVTSVTVQTVPVTSMVYTEYPDEPKELKPGLHATTTRHFVVPLRGSFELTTSKGESRVLGTGDWALIDDADSKGHLTKGVGTERRINLIVNPAEDWATPHA